MKISIIEIALALSVAAPAAWGAPTSAAAREDCGAQHNQTEMNACFDRDLQRADDRLNAAYARRIEAMRDDPDGIRLLRAAERAWVDFREKTCAFEAHGEEGGSVYATLIATCRIAITDARARDMEAAR